MLRLIHSSFDKNIKYQPSHFSGRKLINLKDTLNVVTVGITKASEVRASLDASTRLVYASSNWILKELKEI